ncbi:MAG TPA: type II secretion system F family protein [Candidatus Paceibacterota bacterium]
MPLFHFKAEKTSGEVYEGERSALDKFALYHDLKNEGDIVVSVEEIKEKSATKLFSIFDIVNRVSMRDKILFARNLGSMLEAGLSLGRALSVIERQASKKSTKDVVQSISAEITRGQSLSEALKKYPKVFSRLFVSMVTAGEESGSLPKSLKMVSDQMRSTYLLQKRIRGAMIYPGIIVCVMVVIGILMLVYVVPTLTQVFSELTIQLPWNTRMLIFLSETFKNHSILTVLFLLGLVALFSWGRRTKAGKRLLDTVVLRLPVIKTIVRESNSARMGRTLSSLLSSGVEVVQSIEITAEVVQNSFFREVLDEAKVRLGKGEVLSKVFSEHADLYPVFVAEMTSIGEETGKLAEMLGNIADYYEEEVSQKTKDLSTIIEPVLMILVGCAVAFFALSILSPMYSLVDTI